MDTTSREPGGEFAGSGQRIAAFAIGRPVTVCMLFVSIVVMGVIAVQRIPLMLMPSLDAPFLFVRADYFNATPGQVLDSITKPVEEALATVPGVQRMSSRSTANGMTLQAWTGMGADTSLIRSEVREKIEQVRGDLPEDLRQVAIFNFSTDEIPILEGTLIADRDLRREFEFLDARVKKPLERIPGVGNVDLWGADRRQVEIYLRLDDIKRYGVDVGRLFQSIDGSNLDLSLGRISDGGQRYSAVVKGALQSVDEIARYPIGQQSLVLADVADVFLDQRPRNQGRHHNGANAVGLAIQKTSEANTVEVVDRVMAAFKEWRDDPAMDGLEVRWWHDSAKEIRSGLGELLKAGGIGAVLAITVLLAFLRRLDASLAIGLAIPFSVLTAVGFLYFQGGTLNVLSMMGLMLAAGMLVDNAVVVLEAIFQKHEQGEPAERAARRGAGEVTVAVIAATSTTMIIFVPLLFDSDSPIAIMLSHVGISIIFALLCSLFISLTLIPLACARFLRGGGRAVSALPGRLESLGSRLRPLAERASIRTLADRYAALVRWHLDRRYAVGLAAVPALLGLSIFALVEVVPDNEPNEGAGSSLRIEYEFSEHYHYAKIERDYVNPVERFLHESKDRFKISSTTSQFGNNWAWTRAYLDADKVAVGDVGDIRAGINDGLPVIPGAKISLGQEGGGDRNWINANIYGDDPAVLWALAERARDALSKTEGFGETFSAASGDSGELQIRLRRETARKYNVSPRTVAQLLGITVRTQRMRSYRTAEGEVELWMGIDPSDMQSVDDLKSVVVGGGPSGEPVLLGHVADVRLSKAPRRINRENRRTFTELHAAYEGDKAGDGREKVAKVLDSLPFESGYGWSFGFFTRQQDADVEDFLFNMVLAFVMVYIVTASLFESMLHPFAIMLALPFSVVGIVLLLTITGTPFSAMAQIGIIILIGIAVNNGIVLINHVNNLRRLGMPRQEAILRGCEERFRPICMTALTTIVGLLPLAWGDSGLMGMSYYPLARTVIGGLLASTALTLLVLPTYYVILDDFGRWWRGIWVGARTSSAPEPAAGD